MKYKNFNEFLNDIIKNLKNKSQYFEWSHYKPKETSIGVDGFETFFKNKVIMNDECFYFSICYKNNSFYSLSISKSYENLAKNEKELDIRKKYLEKLLEKKLILT